MQEHRHKSIILSSGSLPIRQREDLAFADQNKFTLHVKIGTAQRSQRAPLEKSNGKCCLYMKSICKNVKEYINKLCEENGEFLGVFASTSKIAYQLRHVYPSVCRPAFISAVPTGQISVEFDIGILTKILREAPILVNIGRQQRAISNMFIPINSTNTASQYTLHQQVNF